MKRLNRHIRALNGALQERPEVFHRVGMHLSIDVLLCVIDHVVSVRVVRAESLIREQFVRVDRRASFDMLTNGRLQMPLLATVESDKTNTAHALFWMALKQSHY